MYWCIVGRRLIGRSVPLLMATLLLALGCAAAPAPPAGGDRSADVARACSR
jgi:hypothetical protein